MMRDAAQSSGMPHCHPAGHLCIHPPWKITWYFPIKSFLHKPLVLLSGLFSMACSGTAVTNRWPSGLLLRSFCQNASQCWRFTHFCFVFVCCFFFFAFVWIAWLAGAKGSCKLCINGNNFNLFIDLNLSVSYNTKEMSSKRLSWYCSTQQRLNVLCLFLWPLYYDSNLTCAFFEGHEALNNSVHLEQLYCSVQQRCTSITNLTCVIVCRRDTHLSEKYLCMSTSTSRNQHAKYF